MAYQNPAMIDCDNLCGCGAIARYEVSDGKLACNKHMRCLSAEETKEALISANKRIHELESAMRNETDDPVDTLNEPTLGRINYETFYAAFHGHKSGGYSKLSARQKSAWQHAANAIVFRSREIKPSVDETGKLK